VRYDGPVRAPIAKGQHIADLIVETPGVGAVSYPLLATADVAAGGVVERLTAAARLLLARLMAPEAS